ncbi:hypothetical protein Glove_21g17 [Diversispora epigaea]|uniref:Uncharacterized protein n=1 Tax=Diversispora epigaea TaxID=1348612 RepID=A0A397JP63_9GLOM|nr:hypothetical protein Glove_21g17 [Diversispora epigaea]
MEDYYAQDDELKALKLHMWMKNDLAQLQEFRKAILKTTWENALAQWTPNNIWICFTNDMGMRVESALLQVHASHFPNEPLVICFDPDNSIKHKYHIQEKPIQIPGSIEIIEAYISTIVNVPLEIVLRRLPAEWKYVGWGTVHRIQRQTIEASERCFIVDYNLRGWINNTVYTACSRVRYMNQLICVASPNDILKYIEPTVLQATPCSQIIEAKLRRYKLDDRKKNRYFPRPLMIVEDWEVDNKSNLIEDSTVCEKLLFLAKNNEENAIPSLTVKDVIEIATWQDKCCKVCCVSLLFQSYSKRHPQSFSVDWLDDTEGHYRQNIKITCLRYNERHRHKKEYDEFIEEYNIRIFNPLTLLDTIAEIVQKLPLENLGIVCWINRIWWEIQVLKGHKLDLEKDYDNAKHRVFDSPINDRLLKLGYEINSRDYWKNFVFHVENDLTIHKQIDNDPKYRDFKVQLALHKENHFLFIKCRESESTYPSAIYFFSRLLKLGYEINSRDYWKNFVFHVENDLTIHKQIDNDPKYRDFKVQLALHKENRASLII